MVEDVEEFISGPLQAVFFCAGLLPGQLLSEAFVQPLWSSYPVGLSSVFSGCVDTQGHPL